MIDPDGYALKLIRSHCELPITATCALPTGNVVEVEIDAVGSAVKPVAIRATAGNGLTSAELRHLPLGEVLRAALERAGVTGLVDPLDAERLRGMGPVPETLEVVANTYAFARATGQRPAKFVADTLAIPRTTATRWIRRAFDKGITR